MNNTNATKTLSRKTTNTLSPDFSKGVVAELTLGYEKQHKPTVLNALRELIPALRPDADAAVCAKVAELTYDSVLRANAMKKASVTLTMADVENAFAEAEKINAIVEADPDAEFGVAVTPVSANSKLGSNEVVFFGSTYTLSCPDSCPLKEHCYALSNWKVCNAAKAAGEVENRRYAGTKERAVNLVFKGVREAALRGAKQYVLRLNVSGDINTKGTNDIDPALLTRLIAVVKAARIYGASLGVNVKAYGYTHCVQNDFNDAQIRRALAEAGIAINYSVETFAEAESAVSRGFVVACASPTPDEDIAEFARRGINATLCKAFEQKRDAQNQPMVDEHNKPVMHSCSECMQCVNCNRHNVIIFKTHGYGEKKAAEAIRFKRISEPAKIA